MGEMARGLVVPDRHKLVPKRGGPIKKCGQARFLRTVQREMIHLPIIGVGPGPSRKVRR